MAVQKNFMQEFELTRIQQEQKFQRNTNHLLRKIRAIRTQFQSLREARNDEQFAGRIKGFHERLSKLRQDQEIKLGHLEANEEVLASFLDSHDSSILALERQQRETGVEHAVRGPPKQTTKQESGPPREDSNQANKTTVM